MNWQTLKYGTLVAAGLAATGTFFWFESPQRPFVRTADFIELFQATQERCWATKVWPDQPDVVTWHTNRVPTWQDDPEGHTWFKYQTDGTRSTNIYKVLAGWTTQVYTLVNCPGDPFYEAPSPCAVGPVAVWHRLAEDSGDRFIWGGYSNVVASGFPEPAANGQYRWKQRRWFGRYSDTPHLTDEYLHTNGLYSLNAFGPGGIIAPRMWSFTEAGCVIAATNFAHPNYSPDLPEYHQYGFIEPGNTWGPYEPGSFLNIGLGSPHVGAWYSGHLGGFGLPITGSVAVSVSGTDMLPWGLRDAPIYRTEVKVNPVCPFAGRAMLVMQQVALYRLIHQDHYPYWGLLGEYANHTLAPGGQFVGLTNWWELSWAYSIRSLYDTLETNTVLQWTHDDDDGDFWATSVRPFQRAVEYRDWYRLVNACRWTADVASEWSRDAPAETLEWIGYGTNIVNIYEDGWADAVARCIGSTAVPAMPSSPYYGPSSWIAVWVSQVDDTTTVYVAKAHRERYVPWVKNTWNGCTKDVDLYAKTRVIPDHWPNPGVETVEYAQDTNMVEGAYVRFDSIADCPEQSSARWLPSGIPFAFPITPPCAPGHSWAKGYYVDDLRAVAKWRFEHCTTPPH